MYSLNIVVRLHNIFEMEKQKQPYSGCVSVLLCNHKIKGKCRIILSCVPCLAVSYIPTLYLTKQNSEKKFLDINTVLGFVCNFVRKSLFF